MVVERMNVKSLLGLPEELEVVSSDVNEKVITITAVSTQTAPCCPLCGTSASRIHSHYSRQLTDMPCAGQRVRLILHVRKFFCDVTTCARKIFTERLAPFIHPWARVTTRLFQAVENIGLATSGMLGARLGDRLGMQTSLLKKSSPERLRKGLPSLSQWLQFDLIAHAFESSNKLLLNDLLVPLIEIIDPQIVIAAVVAQKMVNNHQNAVPHRHCRFLRAFPASKTT